MAFRTSYSQNSTYTGCPQYWNLSYNYRIKSDVESATLYFGSAIDAAITALLEGKPDYVYIFKDKWRKAFQYGKATPIFDNPNIVYSTNDFDEHVLKTKDHDTLLLWAAELNLGDSPDVVGLVKELIKIKKNPHKNLSANQLRFFSRASGLSLKRKGEVLIESFKTQFYPKITKVLATQKYASIKDEASGDLITGYVDMVLEIEGYDRPIIFDLKTAAQPYTQDQIDMSEQLTLYSAMKSQEYNTDLVGYVVLCKNIPKDTEYYCVECGHVKTGKHKTCDNRVDAKEGEKAGSDGKVRCDGAWAGKTILKPEVQVLVEKKSDAQVNSLLEDYANIVLAMKNKIVYKNTSKCNSWYGAPCIYKNLCWKGSMDGLVKKADSK